jgi:serine/threonine-protein kinase HipA
MNKACISIHGIKAAILEQCDNGQYILTYDANYHDAPVSLTMPVTKRRYEFDTFPAFFEGLLPEGSMLEALLRKYKIDKNDYFQQLITVGQDVVGAVTIEAFRENL